MRLTSRVWWGAVGCGGVGGRPRELRVPDNPVAPRCHLSARTNELMKSTKSGTVPNLRDRQRRRH